MKVFNTLKHLVECHIFFVKTSREFMGYDKKDKSKPYPVFGWHTDYDTKPFNPSNKKWGIVGVDYHTYKAYKFKDILYYPIAYSKFMRSSIKD